MRDSDERLQQAVRAGNIGVFDLDLEAGALYCSRELRQIFGWGPDEAVTAAGCLALIHPDERERASEAIRRAHDPSGNGTLDVEIRTIDRRGEVRWILTRSVTSFGGDGVSRRAVRAIGVVQDVTERRQAHQRSEALFRSILDNSADLVAIVDRQASIAFINRASVAVLGYEPGEMTGRSAFDFVHPDDLGAATVALGEVLAAPGRNVCIEIRLRRKDGAWRTLEVIAVNHCDDPFVGGIVANTRDVTERKRAEASLLLKDHAITTSPLAVVMADAEGRLFYVNQAFLRLWGYAAEEEVLGRPGVEFADPETVGRVLGELGAKKSWAGEITARRKDGSRFEARVSAHSIFDADGNMNAMASCSDVTEENRLKAQLMHAQRMDSIGRLAGGVAHDFNNLLTVILGSVDVARKAAGDASPLSEYLSEMDQAARSAAELTHQLLAFSRKEVISPQVLNLNDVVARLQKVMPRLLREDIELRTTCAPDLGPVLFDPRQVEQIIINLAVNAREAMADGGKLTIETANVRFDARHGERYTDVQTGEYVLMVVSDTGSGMSEETRSHLFEPFFSTKEIGQGTGLGLAMVYGAVQQNGGRIEVQSELGHGTTFKIYLPRASGGAVKNARAPQQEDVPTGGETVFLVEDDERVRAFTKAALGRLGYAVHAFSNGPSALAALPEVERLPRLLITDVVMPGMNGRVLSERLIKVVPGLKVLFVSGYTENILVPHGVLKRGTELLSKPYSVDQLGRRVRELLDGDE